MRFANRHSLHITLSLGTKSTSQARIRAAAACAALDRVVAVINKVFVPYGGARPASELADLARRALDAQLGFAVQDQLAGSDPATNEAACVFGDFYALAARRGGRAVLDDTERGRLLVQGRSAEHLQKLERLIAHNADSQVLSDRHLELQLDALGIAARPGQAESDRRVVLSAWADAQHRAALYHTPSVQAQPDPIQYLLDGAHIRAQTAGEASSRAEPAVPDIDESAASSAEASSARLLSSVIAEVVAGVVRKGSWKDGPGSTAEDAERLLNQFCWMVGDLPVDQYTQRHIATFSREMMAMPKTIRVKTVWAKPYEEVKKSFKLTAENTRNGRTMNKDLSYLSTFTERMVAEGYWTEGKINPLALSQKVTAKQKAKAKSPWKVDHVQLMLSCPIFLGNDGPKRRLRPGDGIYQDAAYWLFPQAIYTGACQEELGGLLLDDIVIEDARIPHIIIRDNHLRTLKRDARERVLPIHPRLLALGFADYVAELRREGTTELFPELWVNAVKRGGDQYRSIVWDKLIVWLRAQGAQIPVGINGKASDFHSLRSTVLSLLDRADINQNIVKDIAGHAREGVTAGTYQDLVASGGLDEALRERLIVLKRLPDFAADLTPCTPKLLPLNLRSR